MDSAFYRDTWAEINLDHIYENVRMMRSFLNEEVKLCAVVKANGYGHGDIEVAQTALEAGADFLAVALLDEAISLRRKGITKSILVLGAIRASDAYVAAEHNISVTVFNNDWLLEVVKSLPENLTLSVHIKCDTGMGRLGYKTEKQIGQAEQIIQQSNALTLEGMYTHFATADEIDETYFNRQLKKFTDMVAILKEKPPIIHSGNSAASLRYRHAWFNAIRMGISMYGLSPSMEIKDRLPFPLKEALSLHTKIVYVKKIEANESVSYGATYTANQEEWIATLPIGYADGWLRKLQGQEVLIEGERMPIVGRICMDQCMVRLPKYYPEGTKVTLIGVEKESSITVDEIAGKLDTINYEVACMIGQRIPRVYKRHGEISSIRNGLL